MHIEQYFYHAMALYGNMTTNRTSYAGWTVCVVVCGTLGFVLVLYYNKDLELLKPYL